MAFAAAHPWRPAWPVSQIEAFFDRLISGPDQIIEIWSSGSESASERLAVAVLLDKVSNPGQHACLEIVGLRADAASPALFQLLIQAAEARRSSDLLGIQLAPSAEMGLTTDLLTELGAVHYYDMYEMSCTQPGHLAEHQFDSRAQALALSDFDVYYQLLTESFAENPDASLSDLATAREAYALGNSRIWMISEQKRPLAFVNLIPEQGEIRTLGVAPDARGQGLGKALLGHALAWLAEQQISPACLSVAVRNQRALNLYLQLGFTVTETSSCWLLPATESRAGNY